MVLNPAPYHQQQCLFLVCGLRACPSSAVWWCCPDCEPGDKSSDKHSLGHTWSHFSGIMGLVLDVLRQNHSNKGLCLLWALAMSPSYTNQIKLCVMSAKFQQCLLNLKIVWNVRALLCFPISLLHHQTITIEKGLGLLTSSFFNNKTYCITVFWGKDMSNHNIFKWCIVFPT